MCYISSIKNNNSFLMADNTIDNLVRKNVTWTTIYLASVIFCTGIVLQLKAKETLMRF